MTYALLREEKLVDLKKLSAEELMLRYQTHSPDEAYLAFSELYSRYSSRVFSFLLKKTRNKVESEDLLQKVFIKMHESKHLYREKYKFEQWIFVIARSQVLDYFRSVMRYKKRLEKFTPEEVQTSEDDLSSLASLNEDQHELLAMKFIDDLSYEEISHILNKSEVSLRKSVSRLIGKLRYEH